MECCAELKLACLLHVKAMQSIVASPHALEADIKNARAPTILRKYGWLFTKTKNEEEKRHLRKTIR